MHKEDNGGDPNIVKKISESHVVVLCLNMSITVVNFGVITATKLVATYKMFTHGTSCDCHMNV